MGRPPNRSHVLGLAALLLVAAACDRGGDAADDRGERRVERVTVRSDATGDLAISDDLAAYTAVYEVRTPGRTSSERVVVRRPWESLLEQFRSRRPVGGATAREIGAFGRRLAGTSNPLVIALPPALAPADVRFDALGDAVESGAVERRERRRLDAVDGRECQVLRSAAGVYVSVLDAPAADDDHVDTCVAADGTVVEEVIVSDGRVVSVRALVSLEDAARDEFTIEGEPVAVTDGGGSIQRLTPDSAWPSFMFEPAEAPDGFVKRGRYSVVPPQPENFTDPTREPYRIAGLSDVYERGTDIVVVEQGETLRGVDPFPRPGEGARTIDLGELGTAEVVVSLRMSELRVVRDGGAYVRVYGTLRVAELEAVARSLVERPTGTLTPDPSGVL